MDAKLAWQVNNSFCKRFPEKTNTECYYEPWSSCSIEDVLGSSWNISTLESIKAVTLTRAEIFFFLRSYTMGPHGSRDQETIPHRLRGLPRVIIVKEQHEFKHGFIPYSLQTLLVHCSPVNEKFAFYWWRAVSTAYLLRPNQPVRNWLQENTRRVMISEGDFCVAMYVRRADKVLTEMTLVPLAK